MKSLLPLVLLGSLAAAGCQVNERPARTPSVADTSASITRAATAPLAANPNNDLLLNAASPFEDLTEYAEAGDQAGMDRAIAAYHGEAASLHDVLSPQARQRLDALTSKIEQARETGDRHAVAVNAVEAYRVLIEALDRQALVVPAEVSLMDYAGFKLGVQTRAAQPDWTAMQATAGEARRFWSTIEPRLKDTGLRDAVNTAVGGMERATRTQDLPFAAFAAQVDLDLVDLLEHYFERAH